MGFFLFYISVRPSTPTGAIFHAGAQQENQKSFNWRRGSRADRHRAPVNPTLAALFVSAFLFIQCYISGTRPAFSLPAYALIGIAGIASAVALRSTGGKPFRGCVIATVPFFAYILARAGSSPVEYLARADLYMVLACLVVYGLTVRHFFDSRIRLAILTAMFVLAAGEVLVGLWQFSHNDDWMPFGLVRKPSETRASGMFISSIHFAGYLEAIGPFALGILAWGARNRGARVLAGSVAVLCYFGVIISGSRGGWLSSLFSLVVFAAISFVVVRRTNRARMPAFLYTCVVAVVAAGAGIIALMERSEMLSERMDLVSRIGSVAGQKKDPHAYDIRIYNWQAALDQWRVAPWLGTGAGTHLYYGRQFRRPQLQSDPEHAHGDYLELLAEYGIIGAAGMAVFLAMHLRGGATNFRRLMKQRADDPYSPSNDLGIYIGALTAVSAYLAHSVVDFNLHLPGNALLFAFIFGMLATKDAPAEPGAEPDESAVRRFHAGAMVLPVIAAVLTSVAVSKFPGEYWCEKTRVAVRDGRYKEAIEFGARATAAGQKNPYAFYHLGQAHRLRADDLPRAMQTGHLEAAVSAFRSGLALFPQDEDLWIRLGQTLDALGNYTEARAAYTMVTEKLDPNLGLAHAYFAKHLFRVGRESEAEAAKLRARKLGDQKTGEFIKEYLGDPGSREEQKK